MNISTAAFASQGFAIVPRVIGEEVCDSVAAHLDRLRLDSAGSRRLLQYEWCRDLAEQVRLHPEVSVLLAGDAVAVQCTLFDKSPAKNWLVALHQDRSIPVRDRVESPQL